MNLLCVIPYTPTLIRVRPYQILRALCRLNHQVTLATLWSDEEELADLSQLESMGIRTIAERLLMKRSIGNIIQTLPSRRPLQFAHSWHPGLAHRISTLLKQEPFDAIHVEHLRGARFGLQIQRDMHAQRHNGLSTKPAIIWDSVDCISHLFSQAARQSRSLKGRLMTRFELERTQRFEGWLVNQFDHVIATSISDARALARLAQAELVQSGIEPDRCVSKMIADNGEVDCRSKISVVANGVDLAYFHPTREQCRPTIVFSGKMSYHANITAALYLVEEIMPRVWQQYPGVQVQIVGKDPAPEIWGLRNRCHPEQLLVTGTVPDIRPYLQNASIAVAPVVYGAGIQNKVLEAMSCGAAVVASVQAASGISAQLGTDLLVAHNTGEFSEMILSLLRDGHKRTELAMSGRKYVEQHHSWDSVAEKLTCIYQTAASAVMWGAYTS